MDMILHQMRFDFDLQVRCRWQRAEGNHEMMDAEKSGESFDDMRRSSSQLLQRSTMGVCSKSYGMRWHAHNCPHALNDDDRRRRRRREPNGEQAISFKMQFIRVAADATQASPGKWRQPNAMKIRAHTWLSSALSYCVHMCCSECAAHKSVSSNTIREKKKHNTNTNMRPIVHSHHSRRTRDAFRPHRKKMKTAKRKIPNKFTRWQI